MPQQNKWCYCESTTKAHYLAKAFPKQLQKISYILKSEGVRKSAFIHQVAINVDEIENNLASTKKRNRQSTMDMAFCITKQKAKQALLVELKIRVSNEKNIGERELKQKIKHTKLMLSKDMNISIHQTHLFIFNERVKQRAQNRIRNLFANNPKYKVMGVDEFYQLYFSKS